MITSNQINMLIIGVINELFKKEDERLKKREIELVTENRKVSRGQFDGFFYQGNFYTDTIGGIRGSKANLHSSLVPMMENHVKDRAQIEFDKGRVKQALAVILKDVRNQQDLRDALPNQLAEMIDQIKDLPRKRPEAWTVENDPRKTKQYQALREKIDFYTATRLLY